ncbi:hypothetical protein [Bordetella sp.]|uniref:hypothetical protein n=1 Tax=Bordetella sp. TaxID=28081 RepID=UPI003F7B9B30
MRSVISTCVKSLKALSTMLRAHWQNLEEMTNIAANMLAENLSGRSRRMRPVPIRIDEYRDRRR